MDNLPADLQARLDEAVTLVREVSLQTDPQEMVRRYREHVRRHRPADVTISLSRRDLDPPRFRITRDSRWTEEINPWKERDRLPVLEGGIIADLIYGNEPRALTDFRVDPSDPSAEYLEGMRSLLALPLFDRGESINMVIALMKKPNAIDLDTLPELVISGNLFGRATHNLVMAEQLREAYEALDSEFKTIAAIQRSLLPTAAPCCNGLDMAAYYATAHRAGGDYYDFFPLERGRSGILIADVSGHGAAAAVVMARMHATLHSAALDLSRPAEVLSFANEQLLLRCEAAMDVMTFVTAFYAVYDSVGNSLVYASAGHNPPRWRRSDGGLCSISGARSLPLGIQCGVAYEEDRLALTADDKILLFTDGIVEATDPADEQFGTDRLDEIVMRPHASSQAFVRDVVDAVGQFTDHAPAVDDQTLLALHIS